MRVLITGGSGFLGNNLVRFFLRKGSQVLNYSKETYAINPFSMKDLESNPSYSFIAGDIRDKLLFLRTLRKFEPNIVVHLAASTHVDKSFVYVQDFIENNILGTYALLEVIRHRKKKPLFIYFGTDEIYGEAPLGTYYSEEERLNPENPYAATKASAEMLCIAYYKSFKVPIIRLRSMNMLGPYQHPEKLIAKIITKCLKEEEFTLYKGKSIRGWTYVTDSCKAIETAIKKGKVGEVYNIPATAYRSVPEIVREITRLMRKEYLFKGFKGYRLKDDFRYALNGTKMTHELGWKPSTSLESALKLTIKWYKENKWFWK